MISAGDIFITKLSGGRYVAVRVLRVAGNASLVCTTPYLAKKRPPLNEPLLRKVLLQRRGHFSGEAARVWLDGEPPKSFELLGNVHLSPAEKKIRCDVYGDRWRKSCGQEVFWEWQWQHARLAFQKQARSQREKENAASATPGKPKTMMREDEFWPIIDLINLKPRVKRHEALAPAIEELASRSKREICRFEERLAFLLYQLDTSAHGGDGSDDPADPDYLSADDFLYARCAVVAKGQRFYESVVKRPNTMPREAEFEPLLGLASEAYERKTGEELNYTTGCNYESYSNRAGWKQRSRRR